MDQPTYITNHRREMEMQEGGGSYRACFTAYRSAYSGRSTISIRNQDVGDAVRTVSHALFGFHANHFVLTKAGGFENAWLRLSMCLVLGMFNGLLV